MDGTEDQLPFTYASGEARGLTRGEMRSSRFARPFRGVQATQGDDSNPWLRTRAAALLLPHGAALTGWCALLVRGVPVDWLDGRDREGIEVPVRVEVPRGVQMRKRDGLDVLRRESAIIATIVKALPVASPEVAWLAEIERADRIGALVATDAVLRFGLSTPQRLAKHLELSRGHRGVRLARWAVDLADPYAETPKETEFRLHWIDTGLGRPLANRVILDSQGRFVARTDLVDDDAGVAGEFNGRWHRAGLQPWSDETRIRRLRRTGLEIAITGEPDLRDAGRGARSVVVETYDLAARHSSDRRGWRIGPPPPLPFECDEVLGHARGSRP
jgi:hypothetical protein